MKVGIAVQNEEQRNEISGKHITPETIVQWAATTKELFQITDADFWIDCTFFGTEVPPTDKPLLIHAPSLTLTQLNAGNKVGRFCAWNTFLKREIWEIAIADNTDRIWILDTMRALGWKYILVKDEPGMIAPRIICTIINEAHATLQAGISSKEEIDIAMKLGTNYPFGPLEWGEKIGLQQAHNLLQILSSENVIYQPVFTAH